eukprot:GHRR01001180.1.p1 GENE.GHRR01001180.1~~GHRR01001180.1.p1  ORF type:complete len:102 (+),score=22.90 GHRR01001180.1:75-380(+)
MAQVEGIKNAELQAIAFHMYTKCQDQTKAFEACYSSADKPASQCEEEYAAVTACAKNLVSEAKAAAHQEFHHYTHCLDMMNGKYVYCRPEKAALEEAFPLE